MNQALFLVSALAAGLTLSSCDTPNQDSSGVDTRQALNGLAVDGRVAGGKVWVDRNNNFELDDFEPYSYTDSDGYYSQNLITGANYCALPEISDEYIRHCLVYGSSTDAMIIRIKGGIDLSTLEPLKGVMAMSSTITESSAVTVTPLVLSPLTTLLSAITDDTQKQNIRTALGITSDDDLRLDFSKMETAAAQRLMANAVAVQTMMDILTSAADSGNAESLTQKNIINSITQKIISTGTEPTLFDATTLTSLVSEVSSDTTQQSTVSSRLSDLNAEISKIATATPEEAKRQIKASEVLAQLVKQEASGTNKAAAKKVLDSGISTLSTSLASELTDPDVDFDISSITNSLVKSGKKTTAFDANDISTAVEDSKLATGTVWGGSWFVLEATTDDSDDLTAGSYIAVRLEGNAESPSGRLGVCANASSLDSTDPEDIFENEYASGTWTKISAGSIALFLEYEGTEFEGQMKAKVKLADQPHKFRFTSDVDGVSESGDLVSNVNVASALVNVTRPTSAADCATKVDPLL